MILFVFEGIEREPRLYRTLERLYCPRENDKINSQPTNHIRQSSGAFRYSREHGSYLELFIYEYMK